LINTVEAASRSQTAVAGKVILVIDDNFAIREGLTAILFALFPEVSVYTAANGHLGIKLFQQQWQSISLVLLDMNMPVMNGEQTYEKLQKIAPDVKVIVSSSLSQDEARDRFGEQVLPTFLQKPYPTDTLFHVVKTALAIA
jgi:two-component system, cell cycle sensor histidine kinase and response regulator CckA